MTDTQQLLAEYVRNGSEDAFRELVTRYLALVYSTALRMVGGDAHLARDVAQTVFVDLAREARKLPGDVMLGGWLHRDTCFVAAKTLRGERRRRLRERHAVEMNSMQDHSEPDLKLVAPILDDAINQLGAGDRTAILLRFFEQSDWRTIGKALGGNEDAARMRVNRALEKLRSLLKHRGVNLTAVSLGAVLTGGVVTAAPAGLAAAISSGALAGTAGTGITFTILRLMATTKLKLSLYALVIAGTTTALVIQREAQAKLRGQNEALQQQMAQLQSENARLSARRGPSPHLPAPQLHIFAPGVPAPTEPVEATNLYARLKDKQPKLTREQADSYLNANGRNAANLLAAFRTAGDPALLREAMEKYPNDPQVAFEASFAADLSAAEKRQWLSTFEKSAPDNALANYLSAFNYFSSGQTDPGMRELAAASGKHFEDYSLERYQSDEEAYLAAGYSEADAKAISSMQLTLPQLWQMKQLSLQMVDLANSYRQAGDPASAQATLQMAVNMGQNYANPSAGEATVSQLVGNAIERIALGAMDPNSPYGNDGQTVQDQLNQIAQQNALVRDLSQQFAPLQQTMSDQDWINYKDHWMAFGETAAEQWAVSKFGK